MQDPNKAIYKTICLLRASGLQTLPSKYIPHPPIFNSSPARSMEPTTGAWTWALGSHEWTPNTGSLTLIVNIAIQNKISSTEGIVDISKPELEDLILIINTKKGIEPTKVYKVIHNRAWTRSGWYPYTRIIKKIGAKMNSKELNKTKKFLVEKKTHKRANLCQIKKL